MTVAQPSTPASYFHLLRRQAYARARRPLIVFTPKSMLRLKAAASAVEDFTTARFRPVIGDTTRLDPATVVACCCAPARSTTTCWPSAAKRGDPDDGDRAARAALPADSPR